MNEELSAILADAESVSCVFRMVYKGDIFEVLKSGDASEASQGFREVKGVGVFGFGSGGSAFFDAAFFVVQEGLPIGESLLEFLQLVGVLIIDWFVCEFQSEGE
jgi:hypothetical protein